MLPWDRPLTNIDILQIVECTACLKHIFRGAFSRDELTLLKPVPGIEGGIINLSKSNEEGSHWTSWFKHFNKTVCYYDSFGNLPPPCEFVNYLSDCNIYYNVEREQQFNTVVCGQLCLCFLFKEYSKI